MKNFKKYFSKEYYKKEVYIPLVIWSKKITLPGFAGVPIYDVVTFIIEELKKDDLPTRANSVAFNFFLSIFPFIIFVLPLFSLTPWAEDFIASIENSFEGVLPEYAKDYILSMVESIRTEGNYGLQGVGFVLSIFFASSGMLNLMYGFDKSYSISFKSRSYFKKRLIALYLTVLLAGVLFIVGTLIILGKQLLQLFVSQFDVGPMESVLFVTFKWLMVIILYYSVITIIYRYGPSIYRPLKWINPGATLATICSLLASVLFSYYINHFGQYNQIYGTIGALIVILLWLQINAFIILAGFELNASIIVNRDKLMMQSTDQGENMPEVEDILMS